MYDMKAYYESKSVADAVRLRLEHPEAHIIAGGSDVLVQMREGKRAGVELISIFMLDELRGVTIDEEENIRIGSLTSFSHITRDPIIQKYINVLGEAVDQVGGPQIRNIGTIGGNTCNGVTSADSASTLHAWEAVVELTGSQFARQDCRIAVIAQEVEVAPQRGDGHGVVCRLRRIFRKVVVFQHVKAPVGRGLCGVSLGRAHRRGKGLGHCAAVEMRRTHGDGLCAVRLLKERNGEDDDEHARE